MPLYRNISNQKLYKIINDIVIDTTNGQGDKLMVLYKNKEGKKFVREREEFYQRFQRTNIESF